MVQKGNMMILWSCLAVFVAVSAQGYNMPMVEVEPRGETVVRVGSRLRIMCRISTPLQGCRVEIPGLPSIILKPDQRSDDGISYDGDGFQSGQCGVTIENVLDSYHGDFKCALHPRDSRSETLGTLKIVVAKPPERPELILSKAPNEKYKKGDELVMSCRALSGRPSAKVTLYIDNETLPRDNSRRGYNSNENGFAMVNSTRMLDWTDNGRVIRCVAEHMALDAPMEVRQRLDVHFPPQPQTNIDRFGYIIGMEGIINATVNANPRPVFVWEVGGERIEQGRTDQSQRLQTTSPRELGPGQWYGDLRIDSVQKSDTEKVYVLEAVNDEGRTTYQFRLSTSPQPEGFDLNAGFIIGIVVGVMVLLLLISLIIFARATGRWCFAARRRGDEEAAGGAGAGSEAHITPGDDDDDHEDPHIIDEKMPHGGQENPIHASNEYVNGRNDIKDVQRKDEKTDTPV